MKTSRAFFLSVLSAIMLLPLASAQFYDYTYYTFQSMFQSYAFKFTLLLLFFWLICYYSLKNVFGGKALPASLAAIISFFITGPVLDNFGETILGSEIIKYILIIVAIVAIFFLINVIISFFKKKFSSFTFKGLCILLFALSLTRIAGIWPSSVVTATKFISYNVWTIILIISIVGSIIVWFLPAERQKRRADRLSKQQVDIMAGEAAQKGEMADLELKERKQQIKDREEAKRKMEDIRREAQSLERDEEYEEAAALYEVIGMSHKVIEMRRRAAHKKHEEAARNKVNVDRYGPGE